MKYMTKNPKPQRLSPVIAQIRQEAERQGKTAYALAQATGHSISSMQRMLAGEVSPSLATLEAVASALGLRITVEKD